MWGKFWLISALYKGVTEFSEDSSYGPIMNQRVCSVEITQRFLQTRSVTALLYETVVGMIFRQVLTDGRELPRTPEPTGLGNSVGRWDGDVFVVETNGLRDGGWID